MLQLIDKLLYIELHELDRREFIVRTVGVTQPDLQVICSRLRECLAEPGRIIERTASAASTTPLSIPQRVVWEKSRGSRRTVVASITEIVVANK